MSFWREFKRPILALAPMEDVTDTVFREVVLSVSDSRLLNVIFTEFTSVDGFSHSKEEYDAVKRLKVNYSEKKLLRDKNVKLVAQIWGSSPEKFYKAAQKLASDYDFDGIDINMGCPAKKVIKNKCCSALIQYPQLAKEIILATKEGSNLPVSVKTRIGFNTIDTENWIGHLLETEPDAITIHGRTQKMQSEGNAHWDEIKKAVNLRNIANKNSLIIGNGDVQNISEAKQKTRDYNVDGIMIGRGIFKNVRLFGSESHIPNNIDQQLNLMRQHVKLFEKTWNKNKNYSVLKRFFKVYVNDFYGASNLRAQLMTTNNYCEFENVLELFLKTEAIFHHI